MRGAVHDETSYALGGVAGHAGVFGTADDLLRLGEALRLGGGPMLGPEMVAEMLRDQGAEGAPFRHGLGVRLGDPGIVGPLEGAFGHSGFTGTSLVVDPAHRLTVILLTNAVHPRARPRRHPRPPHRRRHRGPAPGPPNVAWPARSRPARRT